MNMRDWVGGEVRGIGFFNATPENYQIFVPTCFMPSDFLWHLQFWNLCAIILYATLDITEKIEIQECNFVLCHLRKIHFYASPLLPQPQNTYATLGGGIKKGGGIKNKPMGGGGLVGMEADEWG